MKRDEFIASMTELAGSPDRWGHFHLGRSALTGDEYRIKIQKTSWRLELKMKSGWLKMDGGYFDTTNFKIVSGIIKTYRFK